MCVLAQQECSKIICSDEVSTEPSNFLVRNDISTNTTSRKHPSLYTLRCYPGGCINVENEMGSLAALAPLSASPTFFHLILPYPKMRRRRMHSNPAATDKIVPASDRRSSRGRGTFSAKQYGAHMTRIVA